MTDSSSTELASYERPRCAQSSSTRRASRANKGHIRPRAKQPRPSAQCRHHCTPSTLAMQPPPSPPYQRLKWPNSTFDLPQQRQPPHLDLNNLIRILGPQLPSLEATSTSSSAGSQNQQQRHTQPASSASQRSLRDQRDEHHALCAAGPQCRPRLPPATSSDDAAATSARPPRAPPLAMGF